jgi:hypothetical protein
MGLADHSVADGAVDRLRARTARSVVLMGPRIAKSTGFAKKVIAITAPSPQPEHPQQSRSQLGEFAMSDKTNRNLTGEEWRQISGGLFFSEETVHAFEDQLQNVDQISALNQKAYRSEISSGFRDLSPISLALSGPSTGSDRAATALII